MARLQRIAPLGTPQHIIQRGNNRQVCFVCDQDMASYACLLHEYSKEFSVSLHARVFMTNLVHLLASPYDRWHLEHDAVCGKALRTLFQQGVPT